MDFSMKLCDCLPCPTISLSVLLRNQIQYRLSHNRNLQFCYPLIAAILHTDVAKEGQIVLLVIFVILILLWCQISLLNMVKHVKH